MHSLRSAAVQYTNYGTGGAFELPTQSGTYTCMQQAGIYITVTQTLICKILLCNSHAPTDCTEF